MKVKNIIFDVDGVLVNRDIAVARFLQQFSEFKNMSAEDIFKLKKDIPGNYDIALLAKFKDSPIYWERPLFPGVMKTLLELKARGLRLFTISGTNTPDKKRKLMKDIFGDLMTYEFAPEHTKKDGFKEMLEKYGLNPKGTLYIDDSALFLREAKEFDFHLVHSEINYYAPVPEDLAGIPVIRKFADILDLIK